MEIRKGRDLIKRDPKDAVQLMVVSWAQELVRVTLAKDNVDPMYYWIVRTAYSDRVANLSEANPHDVLDCQLYDMLIIREDMSSVVRYPWFDTDGDSTIDFLEGLADKYADPQIWKRSKEKFAGVRRHLEQIRKEEEKRRPR